MDRHAPALTGLATEKAAQADVAERVTHLAAAQVMLINRGYGTALLPDGKLLEGGPPPEC